MEFIKIIIKNININNIYFYLFIIIISILVSYGKWELTTNNQLGSKVKKSTFLFDYLFFIETISTSRAFSLERFDS
jgi:hypothetical protein